MNDTGSVILPRPKHYGGHDVVTASDFGLSRATETVLLARASQERRILVTRDKDFGGLVFVEHLVRVSACETLRKRLG